MSENNMLFTIVTPSFNQAAFLKKTLDSVACQTGVTYEHLIFDPGSTDGSLEIASQYCSKNPAAHLHKGRDRSQTHAINLGWTEARGEIVCWLNSDDHYVTPDILSTIADEFEKSPEVDVIYGRGIFIDSEGKKLRDAFVHRNSSGLRNTFANSLGILQPSLFMRRSAFSKAGLLDQDMNFSFDYEYWARCAAIGLKFKFIDKIISAAVIHEDAKTIRARGISLEESIKVAHRYYDFASIDWVKRIVDQKESGADGITTQSSTVSTDALKDYFIQQNYNARALSQFFNSAAEMNADTHKAFEEWILPSIQRAAVSAWDSNYFDMGVTLIASIHRLDPGIIVFVADIGMTASQRAFINQLDNVVLLNADFPNYTFDWQRDPKNYVFKNLLFMSLSERLSTGTQLLWIDAGVALCRTPESIFNRIEADGYFFIDHDDSRHWPLYNASFTSDAAIKAAALTWREMAAPHVCSCLFGLKIGSEAHDVFQEARKLAQNRDIAVGDKHPPESEKRQALPKTEQILKAGEFSNNYNRVVDIGMLRRIFGYYGHRQDQSIISALVARHSLRISSAREYCPANDESSTVSKENWFDGISKKLGDFRPNDFDPGGVTFHHRGLVKDFRGLRFNFPTTNICSILGNGPSLSAIDFKEFRETDSLGMNAAYRYWHEIGWYPTIYCCLDTIVGMSHKEAILDLVRNRRRYGIKQFLLRDNLFSWLHEQGETGSVVNFDLIRKGFPELHPEPVTTGSHALAWSAAIGYDRFIVAGVDCNYVETVEGSQKNADNTLQIVADTENPNYFFSGYQKVGDAYNIPNPSKDLHVRSWRNVGAKLSFKKSVINVSAISKMDAFPKTPFSVAKKLLAGEGELDSRVLQNFISILQEEIGASQTDHYPAATEQDQILLHHAARLLTGEFSTAAIRQAETALDSTPDESDAKHHLRKVLLHIANRALA